MQRLLERGVFTDALQVVVGLGLLEEVRGARVTFLRGAGDLEDLRDRVFALPEQREPACEVVARQQERGTNGECSTPEAARFVELLQAVAFVAAVVERLVE